MEFEQIWQRFYAPLVVFCRGFRGVQQSGLLEPEDLAQEVLLKVFNHIESYDRNYSMTTWVYRIARNHCIDVLQRAAVVDERPLRGDEPGREIGPELVAERNELEELIDRYLAGLKETDRQIAFQRGFKTPGNSTDYANALRNGKVPPAPDTCGAAECIEGGGVCVRRTVC